MTGLDLETFLRLLRADLGAWASLGAIVLVLALMTWTSWGSRRALRKCLVLSIVIHLGLVAYGRRIPIPLFHLRGRPADSKAAERIKQIRVTPVAKAEDAPEPGPGPNGRRGRRL